MKDASDGKMSKNNIKISSTIKGCGLEWEERN